jgi:hypothetical protein
MPAPATGPIYVGITDFGTLLVVAHVALLARIDECAGHHAPA